MSKHTFTDWKIARTFVQYPEAKSWAWQTYTEFGLSPAYGEELHHFISRYYNDTWVAAYDRENVPELAKTGPPRAHRLDKEFGGWNMRLSNTFWTTGDYDPWRSFQVMSNLPGAPKPSPTLRIPRAGVVPPEGQVFGYLLKPAAHLFEFNDGKQAKRVQGVFADAVRAWLPCFEKKSKEEITPYIPPRCEAGSS